MYESVDEVTKRIKNKRSNYLEQTKLAKNKHSNQKISFYFSKILLAIIFFLSSAIFINYSTKNRNLYEKYVFTDSISFQKFQNIYQKYFGKIIPKTNKQNTQTVFADTSTKEVQINKYYDGVMLTYPETQTINSLKSGIVVFSGNKDNYGNVLIVQGVDGADIWYGNISNISVKLYDYVDKNTVLGQTTDNISYIVINKDGKYLNYEEYIKQNSN